jgi:hypothetical protein
MKILHGPSDEETFNVLKFYNVDEIFRLTILHKLNERFFQLAIDKSIEENDINYDIILINAINYNSLKYVQFAIDNGADINTKQKISFSQGFLDYQCKSIVEKISIPIIIATNNNNLEIVKYLIEHGADVNKQSDTNHTAISYAIKNKNITIKNYLIEHGALEIVENETKNNTNYKYIPCTNYQENKYIPCTNYQEKQNIKFKSFLLKILKKLYIIK